MTNSFSSLSAVRLPRTGSASEGEQFLPISLDAPRPAAFPSKNLLTPYVPLADSHRPTSILSSRPAAGATLSTELPPSTTAFFPRAAPKIAASFCITELPDLSPGKIQVGLFNIMQEGRLFSLKGLSPCALPRSPNVLSGLHRQIPKDYTAAAHHLPRSGPHRSGDSAPPTIPPSVAEG